MPSEQVSALLAAALNYARMGAPVFPVHSLRRTVNGPRCSCQAGLNCGTAGKHPRISDGFRAATTDPAAIRRWWQRWPESNIGLVTGRDSRLVVLDVDPRNGGTDSLAALVDQHGQLPETLTAETGGGGIHYVFRIDRGVNVPGVRGFAAGLDLKADGGYIVAPPSRTTRGYRWLNRMAPAALPGWLSEVAHEHHRVEYHIPEVITEGHRDDTLTSLAGMLRRRGFGVPEIMATLRAANERCVPPLDEESLDRIAQGVASYEEGDVESRMTDVGNARRFVRRFRGKYRYVELWGKWLVWDGSRWVPDTRGQVVSDAQEVPAMLRRQAEELGGENTEGGQRVLKWAAQSENQTRIMAMLKLAQADPAVACLPDQFDMEHILLNCQTGVVDLHGGGLTPHRVSDWHTKIAPVRFDREAPMEPWIEFLMEIMGGNRALVDYLQRAVGYSMTGLTTEQCMFVCHGTGANGKGVFAGSVLRALGDYASQASPDLVQAQKYQGHPTALADLMGKRMIMMSETAEGAHFNEALVKWMTGSDRIKARFMHRDFFEFDPTHTFWLLTNHKPLVRSSDYAFWRRMRLVPFTVTIPQERQNRNLQEQLWAQTAGGAGILRWAIEGALAWHRDGLNEPAVVRNATRDYQRTVDAFGTFLDECCIIDPAESVTAGDLYDAYESWREQNGEQRLSRTGFGMRMRDRGFTTRQNGQGRNTYNGIGIRPMSGSYSVRITAN